VREVRQKSIYRVACDLSRAMTARLRPLAALAGAAALVAATSATAAAPAPFHPRPHSDFTLRESDLRVARFDVNARPRGNRILVSVKLTARSRKSDERAVLRIGRCVGGPSTFPSCPPAFSRAVLLHPRRTIVVSVSALLPRPIARTNAIRISLTPRGKIVRPYRSPHVAMVDMLLPAIAWTTYADRAFGLRVLRPWEGDRLPYDVRTIAARAAQIDQDRLRPTLSWTARGVAPQALVTTTVGACTAGTVCPYAWQRMANQIGRVGFGGRPHVRRTEERQLLTFGARTLSGSLFDLVMPWPR
jgi:hypothetical protein